MARPRPVGFALFAVALWAVTLAVAGVWFFRARGAATAAPVLVPEDPRVVVDVTPAQAALLRRTMRTNVEALDGVLRSSAAGDLAGVGRAARLVLAEAPRTGNPALLARLPADWQVQSAAVQDGFGRLVEAADGGAVPPTDLAAQLAPITAACVTCHQTYRLP